MNYSVNQATGARAASRDEGLRQHMLQTYNLVGSGLFLSAIIAFVSANIPGLMQAIYSSPGLRMVVQFAPLGVLFFLMFKANSMSAQGLRIAFWSFVSLKGLALSYIFLAYGMGDISRALLITAIVFGALSLYGYTTKRHLTGMGMFLGAGVMGLFFIMLGTIVAGFFGVETSGIALVIQTLLVVCIIGLTAYETQQLKHSYYTMPAAMREKVSILTAVNLYINIVILFQYILQFIGNRE